MQTKIEKNFLVFEIIASEMEDLNCLYQGNDAFHRLSVC